MKRSDTVYAAIPSSGSFSLTRSGGAFTFAPGSMLIPIRVTSSPPNHPAKTVAAIAKQRYPEAIITHPVLAGFTDSHYYRELGVMSYGFSPFVASPRELGGGYHGNDERIGKKAYVEGVKFFYEVVERLAK